MHVRNSRGLLRRLRILLHSVVNHNEELLIYWPKIVVAMAAPASTVPTPMTIYDLRYVCYI